MENVTSSVDTKTLCLSNISLRSYEGSTKNHPEVGKVVLLIQEVL